jgi:hypothetical protein
LKNKRAGRQKEIVDNVQDKRNNFVNFLFVYTFLMMHRSKFFPGKEKKVEKTQSLVKKASLYFNRWECSTKQIGSMYEC